MAGLLSHQYGAIRQLERTMASLRRAGLGRGTPAFDALYRARAEVWKGIGFKLPKVIQLLLRLPGLSPGEIKLWHDAETGWMTEARERPGTPPVYHHISDEVAVSILKKELTPALERELMTPVEYYGE